MDSETFNFLTQKAENGDAEVQRQLAKHYAEEKDYIKAVEWYKKAIQAYNISLVKTKDAKYRVASSVKAYFSVFEEWNREAKALEENGDYEGAVKQYSAAAESGNSLALISLADCYTKGKGVEKDNAKAVSLYKRAIVALKRDRRTAGLMLIAKDKYLDFFFKQVSAEIKRNIQFAKRMTVSVK